MKAFGRLFLCASMFLALLLGPAPAAAALPDDGGFVIENYDVQAVIGENNVYDITETIQVNFTQPRHGIFRTIPVNRELTRQGADGETYTTKVRTSVSGVRVDGYKYAVSGGEWEVEIKIGDANKTVVGEQTYKISYRLHFGDDGVNTFDEAYFNIIGTDWDTTIDRATFTIKLPKAFDAEKLGFSAGFSGQQGYDASLLKVSADGNTITGYTTKQLPNYFGITMRLELPQGYFELRLPEFVLMGLIGLLVTAGIVLMVLFGIDYKPVQTVEFNPPEGLTPAEVGFIHDGNVDDRDVISLILYWADKKYLTIEDRGEGGYLLTKLRDMGREGKEYERYMFGKLFKDRTQVTTDELENKFFRTIASTKKEIQAEYEQAGKRVFTKASMKIRPWMSFATILPVILVLYLKLYRDLSIVVFDVFMAIMIGIGLLLPAFYLIHLLRTWRVQPTKARKVKLFVSLLLWTGALAGFFAIVLDKVWAPLAWGAAIGTYILGLCAVFIQKRTKWSAEVDAKINSFRDFIVLAERDRLVALVEQNPSYFYNVLPYAYVLNVTDKFAGNFEGIAMEAPEWYSGMSSAFTPTAFAGSLTRSMGSIESNMTSYPASHSSGGGGGGSSFSGGGSSGGGGGGGGGGSW